MMYEWLYGFAKVGRCALADGNNGLRNSTRQALKSTEQWCHLDILRAMMFFLIVFMADTVMAQVRFQDTTNSAGGPFHTGETWGASWGDFDGDIYPDVFSNNHAEATSIYRNNGDGTFSDVVESADLDQVWTSDTRGDLHGGAWGDFDNDGDQDLFVTRSSRDSHVQLMENNGNSGFRQNSARYRIRPFGGGRMVQLFDYTNDGFLDAAVARNNSAGLELFRWNQNNRQYVRQTDQVGINGKCLANNFAFISDLFNDGKQHYICAPEGRIPERVYDMSTVPFTDVTSKIDRVGAYSDAALADFNGDLRQDMVVLRGRVRPSGATRVSSQRIEAWLSVGGLVNYEKSFSFKANGPITIDLYARNVGDRDGSGVMIGTSGYSPGRLPFTLNPTDSRNWGTVANHRQYSVFVGYDRDTQEWTVFLSSGRRNASSEHVYFTVSGNGLSQPTTRGLTNADQPLAPAFVMNNGSRLVAAGSRGIGPIHCGSVAAADFDNDMDIDLYLGCRTSMENTPNRLYLNNGNGQFTRVSGNFGGEGVLGAGIQGRRGTAEMAITADYDVDGFVDLFVTNGNRLFPHAVKDRFSGGGPVRFIRNLGNNNRWIQFDLRGVRSNRDGFGAKVIVTAGGKSQMREQNGQYHRWSHDHKRLHFGLAGNNSANVRIEWPDGTVDTHNNVAANRLYRATQNGALTVRSAGNSGGGSSGGGGSTSGLSAQNATVDEGDVAAVRVRLDSASSSRITVDYSTVNDSAISGIDYRSRSGTLTFNPGDTVRTISIPTIDDSNAESTESFEVRLSNASGANIAQSVANVEITDNDSQSNSGPLVSIADRTVGEDSSRVAVRFTLSEPSSVPVEVSYTTESGSATAGNDFVSTTGTVSFNPGQVTRYRGFDLIQDNIAEPTETFSLRLLNPVGAQLGNDVNTITIEDDDTGGSNPNTNGGLPVITVNNRTTSEGRARVGVRFSLSEPSSSRVQVSFTSRSGSAVAGADFESRSGSVSFAPGEVEVYRGFDIVQDNVAEPDENFRVVISNPSGVQIGNTQATITIEDDDTAGGGGGPGGNLPVVSVLPRSVSEGVGSVGVRFSLSRASNVPVTVNYTTRAGTARANSDFLPVSGTVRFNPGQVMRYRPLSIVDNNAVEPQEAFSVVVSNPSGARITANSSTITINDND